MHKEGIKTEPRTYYIKSVNIALKILRAINDEDTNVDLAYLSKKMNMHRSHLFRFLATFVEAGFLEREEVNGKYRLSPWAYTIGNNYFSGTYLLDAAKPAMKRLASQCDEAVYLAVKCDNDVLFLDMVDTTQRVAVISLIGNRYPLSQTAAGRVVHAFHSGKRRSLTASVITDLGHGGIDSGDSGLGEGLASVAVPIFNANNEVPGSLCLVGPGCRFTIKRTEEELIPRLVEAGGGVSAKLGCYDPHFKPL